MIKGLKQNESINIKKINLKKKTMKSLMNSQKTEGETDDDDFELEMKSPIEIIKRQKVDTIEEEIWKSNETNLNTSREK